LTNFPSPLHALRKGQPGSQERSQSHPNLKMDKKMAAKMDEINQWTKKSGFDFSKFKSLVTRKKSPGFNQIKFDTLVTSTH
jgi:hypothetical protein